MSVVLYASPYRRQHYERVLQKGDSPEEVARSLVRDSLSAERPASCITGTDYEVTDELRWCTVDGEQL